MDNALAITGFYFTLIGFISGLFFSRLDSWYGEVRRFSGSVNSMQTVEEFKRARCDVSGIKSSNPLGSFISVGLFTTILLLLALSVPIGNEAINPLIFIRLPLAATVLAYWIGGFWLLYSARKLLKTNTEKIEKAFK